MGEIKVSICVIAYNNEQYIDKCLQSILDQEVSFPFEIIVGDDASSDNTVAVIKEFHAKAPEVIRYIVQPQNTGGTENYQAVHRMAKGEYVAHCDGDDYFLPGKLQKQVDFLDSHPGYVQLWHRQQLVDAGGNITGKFPYRYVGFFLNKKLCMKDLAVSYGMVGQHSSHMYRRSARTEYNRDVATIDFFYALDIASKGYSTYRNETLGGYRLDLGKSITTTEKGKNTVEKCLVEAALHYTEKYNLGKQFYGNLRVRKMVTIYSKVTPSVEFEEGFKKLQQYKNWWFTLKALNIYLFVHSSFNLFRILTGYIKILIKRKRA
jgi:glycosyltransferase involved in cell wall biosynthesis